MIFMKATITISASMFRLDTARVAWVSGHGSWCCVSSPRWRKPLSNILTSHDTIWQTQTNYILDANTNTKGVDASQSIKPLLEPKHHPCISHWFHFEITLHDVVSHCDKHFVIWVRMLVPRVASYVCRCWGIWGMASELTCSTQIAERTPFSSELRQQWCFRVNGYAGLGSL